MSTIGEVSPHSKKIVCLQNEVLVAYYPSISMAATILGVSRQAISQAIERKTLVKGFTFMKLYTYQKTTKGARK